MTTAIKISMAVSAACLVFITGFVLAGTPLTGWGITAMVCSYVSLVSGTISLCSRRHTRPGHRDG